MRKKYGNNKLISFAIVLGELALMAITTAVFVTAFNYADIKRTDVSAAKSSSSSVTVLSSNGDTARFEVSDVKQIDDPNLILVNPDHKIPDSYSPNIVYKFNVNIDSKIVEPFQEMRDAALKDNIKIYISSGYRSHDKQERLYTNEIDAFCKAGYSYDEAVSKASKSVAPPGTSEHATGLAIDLNGVREDFGGTKEFDWLVHHAQDYGFILRFPEDKQDITKIKYEPWHYRYVGVEHAKKMKELNMCLEEYIDYLSKNQTSSH